MVITITTNQIKCDNCKKLFTMKNGDSSWLDRLPTKKGLENRGWEAIDGKHYCPNCKLC